CIWARWIGDSPEQFARDSLLRSLGSSEGEKLSGAVHIDGIPRDQLSLLGTLHQEGLIRINGPGVRFSHDLVGDWARFRTLVFAGPEAAARIKSIAHIPRWGRAIRLYGQSLVERAGSDAWNEGYVTLAGDEPEAKLASDLFLDGLLFATNSESLLEQVWPKLIANEGKTLHRLFKRLLHVASFPDWRFLLLAQDHDREQLAVWFRIPQPLYWYPVLRVLKEHAKEVAKHALLQAAEACALWLRTMPEGMAGRNEAGQLTL